MGFLRNLLLAVGVLAASEAGLGTGLRAPLVVLALPLLPSLLVALTFALGKRGRWRAAAFCVRLIDWSAPLVELIAVALCGWSAFASDLLGAGGGSSGWPGPELLLALAPYVVAEFAAIDARARTASPSRATRAGLRRLHGRMFVSAIGPIAGLVALSSLVGLNDGVRAWVEEVALVNGGVTAGMLALFALAMPMILVSAWKTETLPEGWRRQVLESTAKSAGFRCRDIRVWHTSHLMANAAVVGFLPRHRVVLLSDALLAELGPSELAAVFAHEVGHATRKHVWIFGAWALGVLLLADAGLRLLRFEHASYELAVLGAVLLAGYGAFGYLSRRFELDADLASVGTTGDVNGLIRALEQVGGAHAREKRGWRHFSVADRVRFLVANAADASVGLRLRRRLRRWARAGVLLFAVAITLEVWTLARSLPEDRIVVDLRLGRFEAAAERASGRALEPRLESAVLAARGLEGDVPADVLIELSRARLAAGDARGALAYLDLAGLRGADVPVGVPAALAASLKRDSGELGSALERVEDEEWRAALNGLGP